MQAPNNFLAKRRDAYSLVSVQLSSMSDKQLLTLIEQEAQLDRGIGGSTTAIEINGKKVFVKQIALSDLEQQPNNVKSTANLFNLPPYCHYGISSPGFGAWRELALHTMSTEWVLTGCCQNFPIMYHWRILPTSKPSSISSELIEKLETEVKYWGGLESMRTRLQAINTASANIVIFSEYIPQTLSAWLSDKLAEGERAADLAVEMVEKQLQVLTNFLKVKGLIHFDAHPRNILTDGHSLYLTDFGLALHNTFEMEEAEAKFFQEHVSYDRCETIMRLVQILITNFFGKDNWQLRLQEYISGKQKPLSPPIASIINKYAPVAFIMSEFLQSLQRDKTTVYPKSKLERIDQDV